MERPTTLSPTEFLTMAETAAILKVSRKTVSGWIDQGALPAVRLGPGKRLIRVRRKDLESFIAQGETSRAPETEETAPDIDP